MWYRGRALEAAAFQVLRRRPLDRSPVSGVAGAVAGAIPRPLRLVPVDEAVEVLADGQKPVERALLVAIHRGFPAADPDERTLARLQLVDGGAAGSRETVGDEVETCRGVLSEKARQARPAHEPLRVVELRPRVRPAQDAIRQDHRGRRS